MGWNQTFDLSMPGSNFNSRLRRGGDATLPYMAFSPKRMVRLSSSFLSSFPPRTDCGFSPTPHSTLRREEGREEVHSAAPHDSSSVNRRASEQACGHMCAGVCVSAIYFRHPTSVFALLCLASPYLFIRAAVIDMRLCCPPFPSPAHYVGYVWTEDTFSAFCRGLRSPFVLRNRDRQRITPCTLYCTSAK